MGWLALLVTGAVFLALFCSLLLWQRRQPARAKDGLRDALARLMPRRAAAALALLGLVVGGALILLVDHDWSLLIGVLIMFVASAPFVAGMAQGQGRRFL